LFDSLLSVLGLVKDFFRKLVLDAEYQFFYKIKIKKVQMCIFPQEGEYFNETA
jgi:hypothetical protein